MDKPAEDYQSTDCTVCLGMFARRWDKNPHDQFWQCKRCGHFALVGTAKNIVHSLSDTERSLVSQYIRRRHVDNEHVLIFEDDINIIKIGHLPMPSEQIDNMILWIGSNQPAVETPVTTSFPALSAWIGLKITREHPGQALTWMSEQSSVKELLNVTGRTEDVVQYQLTLAGWDRWETLKATQPDTKIAFMAMKFSDEMKDVFHRCFRPAAERAGFDLRLLTHGQSAGLIDAQIRAALRQARFIVADLTDLNRGAYWEAGFGEGMGRPVIYTCRDDVFYADDLNKRPHFDTNHLVTVVWKPDDLFQAGAALTAIIRNSMHDAIRPSLSELMVESEA